MLEEGHCIRYAKRDDGGERLFLLGILKVRLLDTTSGRRPILGHCPEWKDNF